MINFSYNYKCFSNKKYDQSIFKIFPNYVNIIIRRDSIINYDSIFHF